MVVTKGSQSKGHILKVRKTKNEVRLEHHVYVCFGRKDTVQIQERKMQMARFLRMCHYQSKPRTISTYVTYPRPMDRCLLTKF